MKIYWWTGCLGLVLVLTGCGTGGSMVRTSGASQPGVNPQLQAFSGLGEVSQTEKGIQVVLSGDSLFKIGRSHLSQDGLQKADAIASVLTKYPGDLVAIMEYTDNSGSDTKNLRISQRRADSIKRELVKQSVPSDNVTAVGNGDTNPVAPNDTPDNRARNRRVVIEITTS
jgi:outer membrane protein OmpA-like peptidoglycan-associated protein